MFILKPPIKVSFRFLISHLSVHMVPRVASQISGVHLSLALLPALCSIRLCIVLILFALLQVRPFNPLLQGVAFSDQMRS